PTDVVHNVAQAEHELRAGALRLEGIQAVAKLTLGAERLVIDQDQVRGQSQGGGAQDLTADGPEALLGRLLLGRGPLHTLRRVEAQQLHQQAWYAGEAAQIDPTAGGRERTRIAGQPVGQRLRAQVVGVQHVDQAQIPQALSANPLLGLRLDARHDERVLLKREDFANRAVATHRDDPAGALNP